MPDIFLIPQPVSVVRQSGEFRLDSATTVFGPDIEFGRRLRAQTLLPLAPATGQTSGQIRLEQSSDLQDGYTIEVSPEGVVVRAAHDAGFAAAYATFAQLLPVETFGRRRAGDPIAIPCLAIEDSPRFSWRGGHLDVARHYMPLDFLYRYIDLLAMHKFNVFHLHLTEDQGWRMEIEAYPRLTSIGGWRHRSMAGHVTEERWDSQPVGGFYRKDDLRHLVAYAAMRGITIVPEIELPGHAQAALAAYPEFGNNGERLGVWDRWGVSDNVYAPTDAALGFLKDVLREVLEVFPSEFIHIGGDECPKTQWKNSEVAQGRIREKSLVDENGLQSWFISQIGEFLAGEGRRMIGWDEILEGGLPSGATVMSWRGTEGGIAAARAGHDVVMTPGTPTYFDHYQSSDKESEPLAIGGCNVLRAVYDYEPIPTELAEDERHHVLGSQFQIWTEYMKTPAKVEYMAYPRACALAEVLWSPKQARDWDSFRARLDVHERRLTEMGVHFRSEQPGPGNLTLL